MKLIPLTGKYGSIIGNYAQVDDEDYEHLMQWKWFCRKKPNTYYVGRVSTIKERKAGSHTCIDLHRYILNITSSDIQGDHIDRNGLNNQKSNLRIATRSQNQANKCKLNKNCSSKYMGVISYKKDNKIYWRAGCKKDGKSYERSRTSEKLAAIAYNELAISLHGEFARLNIIENE